MKKILMTVLLLTAIVSAGDKGAKKINPAGLVNPLVGTDSDYKLSNGNTYPAIALPWAMNFWSPQTGKMGSGWMYTYDEYKIKGFRQTHQPSPWIGDYGSFSIMPITGTLKFPEDERASWFSHKREIAKPYYYQVYLGDYNVSVEITPTERAAQFRVKYPKTDNSYLLIDAFNKGSYIKVIPKEKKLIGYCRNNKGGVPENFHNYFVVYFDKEIDSVCTWSEKGIFPGRTEDTADHVMAAVKFKTNENETVHIRTASSFISFEQAELNLKREVGNDSFTETMTKAEKVWNDGLSRIEIEGGTESQMKTFYTALYRTMLFPRGLYEMDKDNKVVHYSPYDGVVHPGYMFTDNGFWDTFRAAFPLLTIMQPGLCSHIMEGLVNTYNESGWLPEWASPGHRDCMIGSNSASVIAGTYLNGIRGYDINKLYEAILKNSENEGPLESVGRRGVKYYNSLGYVPYDVKINENAARTLEYSYDDFAIWKLAQALGRPKDETDRFARRSMNYKNVFDKSTGFMRGRDSNGTFQSPFRPDKWGDAFTEGCAWHYTWAVFHDPAGLMNLMGGREKFAAKLDSLFTAAPTFDYSYYGVQIHEITEMVIAGMGQYAHGNQPVQHAIYLYNYAGEPWKAQQHVREAMDILYTPEPDGLCGDEDNGQTSAWYVLSALGMYSVCPAAGEYVFGSPLFNKAVLHLENGKTFTIEASDNSHENIYIDKASLNGKDYTKNFLTHRDLMQGGSLEFRMSNKPNKDRGTGKGDMPYSFSE
ncbi:MAG: glycoside hydrolase family 92 protein [Ignavibacteria bacterium]|jgi:predicted alpha-1,2-mannosidase|nr:glycoside hydrolase family 92 protein [Ignavibacteria bacterium]